MNDHEQHEHSHSPQEISRTRVFWVALFNLIITVTEFVGGILSGSLALVSDATHNLSDTASIVLSYIGIKISSKEKTEKKSFGYKRAEIIIAFINASVLMGICLYLMFEAYERFTEPVDINGNLMITIAVIGLAANLISMLLLHSHAHTSMNIKAAYLHMLGDTLSSVGVVGGGLAIKFWGLFWIDPLITVVVALFIIRESWKIVKRSLDILMQSSADLDYDAIKKDIEAIESVNNIHHVHTWYSNERTIYFEAHVSLCDILISQTKPILDKIEHILKEKYGVSHITIQFEDDKSCPCENKMFNSDSK
jgi:cobalt-zinc-cadmium efflux system protein